MYQADPAEAVRSAARHVRPGGVVVFAEMCLLMGSAMPERSLVSWPPTPASEQLSEWIHEAFGRLGTQPDMGLRLPATFAQAGLQPSLDLDSEVAIAVGEDAIAHTVDLAAQPAAGNTRRRDRHRGGRRHRHPRRASTCRDRTDRAGRLLANRVRRVRHQAQIGMTVVERYRTCRVLRVFRCWVMRTNSRALPLCTTAEKWARRYGPMFRADIGRRRIVGISDAEAINMILRERPEGSAAGQSSRSLMDEMGLSGVFTAEGEQWKRQRRLVITALNTNHLHRYYEVIRTSTERLHRRLSERGPGGPGARDRPGADLLQPGCHICACVRADLNTLERGEDELQEHIQRAFGMLVRRIAAPFPYWRWIKLPADRALDRSLAELHRATVQFIEQARQRMRERPELREAPENFLESMISAQENDGAFTDSEIIGNTLILLFAGEDTTAHTLGWTIWLLATHPDVQERLAAEASEVLGEDPFPDDYEVIGELDYTEAVLRESLRVKGVTPLITAEPLADTTICDTHIPAGTQLLMLLRYPNLGDAV